MPFIARYRKEATGSLDEVAVAAVRDRMAQLAELDKRRDSILASLSERGLLDDELRRRVTGAETLPALEDVYLPHRPKRRTRAMDTAVSGALDNSPKRFSNLSNCRPPNPSSHSTILRHRPERRRRGRSRRPE